MKEAESRHVRVIKREDRTSSGPPIFAAIVLSGIFLSLLVLGGAFLTGWGLAFTRSLSTAGVKDLEAVGEARSRGGTRNDSTAADGSLGGPSRGDKAGGKLDNSGLERAGNNTADIPEGTRSRGGMASLPSVKPRTPWKALSETQVLTRIGVGSCLSQRRSQPIWGDILGLAKRPELFLMIGDNVYGDIKHPDYREMVEAYRAQGRHQEFSLARAAFPFLAMWDDHDYGGNDAGSEFVYKEASAKFFSDFWQIDTGRSEGGGIYYARMIGPPGKRVHMIFLDTRTFRSKLMTMSGAKPYWGRYQPSSDAALSMLGRAQWDWFENELSRQADFRIVVSSVQVLASGHGFERWGNMPFELERLLNMFLVTRAVPTVLLSGDRHMGGFYELPFPGSRVLPEITTSSLNRSYGPSKDIRGPEQLSDLYHQENFALIDIDWEGRAVEISLRGLHGKIFHVVNYAFSRLGNAGRGFDAGAR